MLKSNDFSFLPCSREDFSAISKRGHFCYPPYDPTEDDDPTSLDTFFCNALSESEDEHYFKTYKFVKNDSPKDILALACISNSSMVFDTYESKPVELQDSGFNEAIPAVMLIAFGVRDNCQKLGIGSLAFEKIKKMIRQESIAGVRILTLHPLESAIPFYQAQHCQIVYADEFESEVSLMYIDVWK